MSEEHQLSISNFPIKASEIEARRIFDQLSVKDIKDVYATFFSDLDQMQRYLKSPTPWMELMGRKSVSTLAERLQDSEDAVRSLTASKPDVAILFELLRNSEVLKSLGEKFLRSFKELIINPRYPDHHLINQLSMIFYGGSNRVLRLALLCLYVKPESQDGLSDHNPNTPAEKIRLITGLPDLSGLTTPAARFDGFTRLLTYSHQDAVIEVCEELNLQPSVLPELKDQNRKKHKEVYTKAGLMFYQNNLYAILKDLEHGQTLDAFRHQPGLNTRDHVYGRCLAEPHVRNYFLGVGQALRDNRDTVLEVMTTFR